MPGTLFVVATPIGNLEDLTFRALRILKEVALIAAEDTRRTAKLLAHYEIRCPMVSLHEHNEFHEAPGIVARLVGGISVALVSDAGTPGIADPGARLVSLARAAGVPVVPIPGASAVATALSATGLEGREFVFMGFVPPRGREREEWMDRLVAEPRIVCFFESPHRIVRTVSELAHELGDRPIMIFRELTKINESLVICHQSIEQVSEAVQAIPEIGEFTVVIGPSSRGILRRSQEADQGRVFDVFSHLTDSSGFTTDEATAMCSGLFGLTLPQVAKIVKKARIAQRQAGSGASDAP